MAIFIGERGVNRSKTPFFPHWLVIFTFLGVSGVLIGLGFHNSVAGLRKSQNDRHVEFGVCSSKKATKQPYRMLLCRGVLGRMHIQSEWTKELMSLSIDGRPPGARKRPKEEETN
eukprot:1561293-Amphidinium_carterae.1